MGVDSTLLPLLAPPASCSPPPTIEKISFRPSHIPTSNPFADSPSKSNLRAVRGWQVTTHAFPAAFPRTKLNSTILNSQSSFSSSTPPSDITNSNNKSSNSSNNSTTINQSTSTETINPSSPKQVQDNASLIVSLIEKHDSEPDTDIHNPAHIEQQKQMWIAVNHYIPPRPVPGGVTLIFNHGLSFHKELWEPTLSEILCHPDCPPIAEIWCLDNVIHGDSAVLNRDIIGTAYDTRDEARDNMQFLLRYLPSADLIHDNNLPVVLPCLRSGDIDLEAMRAECLKTPPPKNPLYRGRQIFNVSHSMGGASAAYNVANLPFIYSGMIIIDPIVLPLQYSIEEGLVYFLEGALRRRVSWKDIETATKSLHKNRAVYGRWRYDVLDRFIHFGLMPTPGDDTGAVTLKTRRDEEKLACSDGIIAHRSFLRLKDISKNIPVHWIYPEGGSPVRTWTHKPCNDEISHSTMTILKLKGHLLPMDYPRELAGEIVKTFGNFGVKAPLHGKSRL